LILVRSDWLMKVIWTGYYPPGYEFAGADGTDTFEALLELANLLGEVRSRTATTEQIERSGLEVIKAKEIASYEKEGRVHANCVERVSIFLDTRASKC
jgi:hypothetical protein